MTTIGERALVRLHGAPTHLAGRIHGETIGAMTTGMTGLDHLAESNTIRTLAHHVHAIVLRLCDSATFPQLGAEACALPCDRAATMIIARVSTGTF